jgi:hypothetical protein
MKYYFLIALFILGCSSKDVFMPKNPVEKKLNNKTQTKELYFYTKKTLTFRELDLTYKNPDMFDKDGANGEYVYYTEDNKKLGKYKLVNKNLAVNGKKLLIVDENKTISFDDLIFSASKKNNFLALVFENNAFGVYDLDKDKMIFYQKDEPTLSSKFLFANPLFYKDLILFPMLRGKVEIYDLKNNKYINSIFVSDSPINDNIIFMKIVNNQLFIASPTRLILFNPNFLINYDADIKHILSDGKYLYLFLVGGKVVKLDSNLKKIKEINLKFADYFAPSICNGEIYTVTSNKYLVKLTKDLNVTVYKGNYFDTHSPLKIKGCKIYNSDKVYFIE